MTYPPRFRLSLAALVVATLLTAIPGAFAWSGGSDDGGGSGGGGGNGGGGEARSAKGRSASGSPAGPSRRLRVSA